MSMKWPMAGCKRKRTGALKGTVALKRAVALSALALMLLLAAGCGLAPPAPEAELINLIEPPKLSKKPEFTVARATIETKATATGKLMSQRQEQLRFRGESGRIAQVLAGAGDQVKQGQVIAILDTGSLEDQLERKDIEVRQAELSMIEKLRDDSRPAIQRELDKLNFELITKEREKLREQLEAAKLRAPFAGTLVSFTKEEGDMINAYEAVGTIADLDKLVVAVKFSSSDLASIVPGMEAAVQINLAGSFAGRVSRLPLDSAAAGKENSLDGYVLIELDEFPSDVKAGTPLSAAVITERRENAVLIPPAALRTVSGRNYVQVVDAQGNKREVDVEVGLSTATAVEIVKGLEPGQKVLGK